MYIDELDQYLDGFIRYKKNSFGFCMCIYGWAIKVVIYSQYV